MVTDFKDEDNILNMCKTLVAAANQNLKIPKFAILSPCEVPTIGEAVIPQLYPGSMSYRVNWTAFWQTYLTLQVASLTSHWSCPKVMTQCLNPRML